MNKILNFQRKLLLNPISYQYVSINAGIKTVKDGRARVEKKREVISRAKLSLLSPIRSNTEQKKKIDSLYGSAKKIELGRLIQNKTVFEEKLKLYERSERLATKTIALKAQIPKAPTFRSLQI